MVWVRKNRIATGASTTDDTDSTDVLKMILRQGMTLALLGVVLGLAGAYVLNEDEELRIENCKFQIPDYSRSQIADSRFQVPDFSLQIPESADFRMRRFQIADSGLKMEVGAV